MRPWARDRRLSQSPPGWAMRPPRSRTARSRPLRTTPCPWIRRSGLQDQLSALNQHAANYQVTAVPASTMRSSAACWVSRRNQISLASVSFGPTWPPLFSGTPKTFVLVVETRSGERRLMACPLDYVLRVGDDPLRGLSSLEVRMLPRCSMEACGQFTSYLRDRSFTFNSSRRDWSSLVSRSSISRLLMST